MIKNTTMKFIKFPLLSIFTMAIAMGCHAPKKATPAQHIDNPQQMEIPQNNQLFISGFSGGSGVREYKILKTQQEYHAVMRQYQPSEKLSAAPRSFPEDQMVVLYNQGEYRSGDHKVTGIDSMRLDGDVLKVYTTPKPQKPQPGDLQIQVISQPWFIFSVPKDLKFKEIEVK